MTNKEKAKEYAASKHKDKELQKIVALDFVAGAEWKEQQFMKWLTCDAKFYDKYGYEIYIDTDTLIENLKQAMKED